MGNSSGYRLQSVAVAFMVVRGSPRDFVIPVPRTSLEPGHLEVVRQYGAKALPSDPSASLLIPGDTALPPPGSLKKRTFDEGELEETLEAQFNLPRIETRAYIKLIQTRDLTVQETANLLGLDEEEAANILEKMESRGLIIRSPGDVPRFTPLHPRMTLTNIFKMHEKEVVQGLRDRRATVDRVVNLLTPVYEERKN